jgi:hypothetical protein
MINYYFSITDQQTKTTCNIKNNSDGLLTSIFGNIFKNKNANLTYKLSDFTYMEILQLCSFLNDLETNLIQQNPGIELTGNFTKRYNKSYNKYILYIYYYNRFF